MKEIISIKRKDFEVLETLGEHSFKVERHGKIFFLKKYDNKDKFNDFIKKSHRLKITAIDTPKVYMFDKDQMISVVEFIEGPTMLECLSKEDINNEEIYRLLMLIEWYGRREKIRIDFLPENFIFTGKKLVYLPYTFKDFEQGYNFNMKDIRYWFPTKELSAYVKSKGLSFDDKRIGNEYAVNKQIALMVVKYHM